MLPLRVGNDVATINDVMGVIEIFSSRREYTNLNPFIPYLTMFKMIAFTLFVLCMDSIYAIDHSDASVAKEHKISTRQIIQSD